MKTGYRVLFVLLVILLAGVKSASATPIGLFRYEIDDAAGPLFKIFNESFNLPAGAAFTDVKIHLSLGATAVADINVDSSIDIGFQVQTIDDLTFPFDAAVLEFGFAQPGTVDSATLSLTALGFSGDADSGFVGEPQQIVIEFSPAAPPSQQPDPIPEPATLLLTSLGGAIVAAKRLRQKRS